MASKAATAPTPEEEAKLPVAQSGGGDLATLFQEAEGLEGEGTSSAADDNIIPFVQLLQDLSPQTKKRDPAYIEGAEPGLWLNKATGELMKEFDFQPCAYQRVVMQWRPRDSGGGVVGRHPHKAPTIEDTLKEAGGKEILDTRDSTGRKKKWVTEDGDDLIDTRYFFGHVVYSDGSAGPAVISFSSTGHQAARQLMTMMTGPNALLPKTGGGKVKAPAYFRKYRFSSTTRSNNSGEWFVPKIEDLGQDGWILSGDVRAAGKMLHDSVMSGVVQAAAEEPAEGSGGGGGRAPEDDDLPF